jgi:hypothetical protein
MNVFECTYSIFMVYFNVFQCIWKYSSKLECIWMYLEYIWMHLNVFILYLNIFQCTYKIFMVYLNVCIAYLNVFECIFVVYFNVSIIYFNAFIVHFNVFQCVYNIFQCIYSTFQCISMCLNVFINIVIGISPSYSHYNIFAMHTTYTFFKYFIQWLPSQHAIPLHSFFSIPIDPFQLSYNLSLLFTSIHHLTFHIPHSMSSLVARSIAEPKFLY